MLASKNGRKGEHMTEGQKELLLSKMARAGYRTYESLSKKIGMSPSALSNRISGKINWTDKEMKTVITELRLSTREAFDIFLS